MVPNIFRYATKELSQDALGFTDLTPPDQLAEGQGDFSMSVSMQPEVGQKLFEDIEGSGCLPAQEFGSDLRKRHGVCLERPPGRAVDLEALLRNMQSSEPLRLG